MLTSHASVSSCTWWPPSEWALGASWHLTWAWPPSWGVRIDRWRSHKGQGGWAVHSRCVPSADFSLFRGAGWHELPPSLASLGCSRMDAWGQPLGGVHLGAYLAYALPFLPDRVVGWAWCSQRHATVLGLLHLLRLCDPHNIGPKRLLSWWRYCLIGPDRVDRVHAAALSTRCHLSRMAHTLRGVVRCANLYRS